MQKELQFTLSIIGILIIGGVLLHGIWTIRKNAKKQKKARLDSRDWEPGFEREDTASDEAPLYDDVGVSKARVILNPESDVLDPEDVNGVSVSIHEEVIESQSTGDLVDTEALTKDELTSNAANSELDDVNASQMDDLEPDEIDEVITKNIDGQKILDSGVSTANDAIYDTNNELTNSSSANDETQDDAISIDANDVKVKSESPVYSNVVTQPKPEFSRPVHGSTNNDDSFGQPPEFLLKKTVDENEEKSEEPGIQDEQAAKVDTLVDTKKPSEPSPDFSLNIQEGPEEKGNGEEEIAPIGVEKELSFAEQAKRFVRRNKKTVAEKIRKEPVLKDKAAADQMRMDFDESESAKIQDTVALDEGSNTKPASSKASNVGGETDVLVLNVRASDENPIQGASLLPMLLTLGFKFGEHDIFHRHVSTNGKGPILFSLTNMFKPGVFDIDNIENFSTHGLSLFMMLPIEGDAQQVFNMMHNAARKLSDEFGCRILDGNKVGVSKQSLQQYVERIREFERKRINK